MLQPWTQKKIIVQSGLILDSYRHWTGKDLLPKMQDEGERAHQLFEAPFVVVSHGTEADPILNYGNKKALELWEMTWDSFIHTPSRLTTEIVNRKEREQLLTKVSEQGYSQDYRGIRISSSGKRFRIEEAVVWNIVDENGVHFGQAAAFKKWRHLD
ncbi:MAG: MEKHLA domain-containing protein [bacterium]|nr:MEKHLA domain-containing protein [bacterium]